MKAYRQGEILFFPQTINDIESFMEKIEAREKKFPRTSIVAEGASSGHKHEIDNPKTGWAINIEGEYDIPTYGDNLISVTGFQKVLFAETNVKIKHPEHKTLELPAGIYFTKAQREFDEEFERQIVD